jgi:hypothetical protein
MPVEFFNGAGFHLYNAFSKAVSSGREIVPCKKLKQLKLSFLNS